MTRLTPSEISDTQAFIDRQLTVASAKGLTVDVHDDLWEWRDVMNTAPGTVGPSKTLDPLLNDIRPGNSFWLKLSDRNGEIIGTQANRFIVCDDFVEEYVCTHRFFGDRCPPLSLYPVSLEEAVPVLAGRLGFGGGGWVRPDWRGQAIAGLMSRICRTLLLRHFLIDYYVGFITATQNHRQYGRHRQGLMNRRHLLSGVYPGRDENVDVDIYWMHRGELLAQISNELTSGSDSTEELMKRTA